MGRGILNPCFPTINGLPNSRLIFSMQEYTYQDMTQALQRAGIAPDASECHGAMSAVICFMGQDGYTTWLGAHLPELEAAVSNGDALASETGALMAAMYDQVCDQLMSGNLGFYLLLPDDDIDLEIRSQAMVHWCQGFMLGLNFVGVTDQNRLGGELQEIVQDITEISQMSIGGLEYTEEEEQSYAELVEYLKVGVMLFRETLYARQNGSSSSTIH